MTPEGFIQDLILDWLAAKHILAYRMNTGAMKIDKRYVKFGVKGMADILAFPTYIVLQHPGVAKEYTVPLWIEVKSDKGKQSLEQKSFQDQVEEHGHNYIVARSIEDVEAAL